MFEKKQLTIACSILLSIATVFPPVDAALKGEKRKKNEKLIFTFKHNKIIIIMKNLHYFLFIYLIVIYKPTQISSCKVNAYIKITTFNSSFVIIMSNKAKREPAKRSNKF